MSPRRYKPTPEQRDERVNTEHDADKLIRAVLKAGPHPKDEPEKAKAKRNRKSSRGRH